MPAQNAAGQRARRVILVFLFCSFALMAWGYIGDRVGVVAGQSDGPNLHNYRMDQLEKRVEAAAAERQWIIGLLIANLAGIIVTLALSRRRPP